MATAAATLLLLVVIACLQKEACSNRPSYAGISGGTWSNYVGQIIPLGTPWPAKAEDYSTTPKPTLEDKLYTISSTKTATSGTTGPVNVTDTSRTTMEAHIENSSKVPSSSRPTIVLEYQPNRPSFAGSTGGTWESYVGQRVPPGTHWPEKVDKSTSLPPKKENGLSSSGTTIQEEQSYTTVSYQNATTEAVLNQTNKGHSGVKPSTVLEYKPNRPSFAGSTGGTWEGYLVQKKPNGTTVDKPTNVISNSNSSTTSRPSIVLEYQPDRPSFAGSTGGTLVGQRVPNGTTTEKQGNDSPIFTTTSGPSTVLDYKPIRPSFAGSTGGTWESLVGQRVPNSTTTEKQAIISPSTTSNSIILEYKPNRPSFAGSTGGTWESLVGQRVPNGTTTEKQGNDFPIFTTTSSPSIVLDYKPNRPSFAGSTGGTWENLVGQRIPDSSTTTEKQSVVVVNSTSTVLEYQPNRPSFAGSTGGTWESLVGQKVPNGTTTEKQGNDSPVFTTTSSPSIVLDYKPNRPSFAGSTGGTWENLVGQRIPDSSTTTEKQSVVVVNSTSTVLEYQPNRPSFAGSTGGTWESLVGQRVPNGTTTEKQGNDSPVFTTTSSPSIVLDYKPNRPSFAGSTGGTWENLVGQRIPDSSTTTEKQSVVVVNSTSTVLEYQPNRPSFAGSTGGTWESLVGQKVPNGTTTEKQGNDSPVFTTTSSPSIVLDYKPNRPSFAGSTGGTWENLVGQRIPDSSTTTEKQSVVVVNSTSTVLEYQPNRPSFAGSTGGTWESLVGQRVPNGTTTEKQGNDSPVFTTTSSPSIVLDYKPNRPSFAGSTGGTWESLVGQRVPDGSTTTDKETNVLNSTSSTILEYQPNRPSFAGSTGGTWGSLVGQRTPNGTTSEKQVNVSSISDSPAYNASPVLEYQPNRPNVDGDINEDIIKATKKFLEAEKCKDNFTNKDNTTDVQIVLNSILNIERDRDEK